MKIFFILAAFFAMADNAWAASDCRDNAQIDVCERQVKDASEQKLNIAWTEAKQRIAAAYHADAQWQKTLQQDLLNAQRGWLTYRENQCKMQAFLAEEGTVAYSTLTNRCISQLNQTRIEQLDKMPYQ